MNLIAIHNSALINSHIGVVLNNVLLSVLGIQILPVLAPVHYCGKRFKL